MYDLNLAYEVHAVDKFLTHLPVLQTGHHLKLCHLCLFINPSHPHSNPSRLTKIFHLHLRLKNNLLHIQLPNRPTLNHIQIFSNPLRISPQVHYKLLNHRRIDRPPNYQFYHQRDELMGHYGRVCGQLQVCDIWDCDGVWDGVGAGVDCCANGVQESDVITDLTHPGAILCRSLTRFQRPGA